jgi:hypothetical protein
MTISGSSPQSDLMPETPLVEEYVVAAYREVNVEDRGRVHSDGIPYS